MKTFVFFFFLLISVNLYANDDLVTLLSNEFGIDFHRIRMYDSDVSELGNARVLIFDVDLTIEEINDPGPFTPQEIRKLRNAIVENQFYHIGYAYDEQILSDHGTFVYSYITFQMHGLDLSSTAISRTLIVIQDNSATVIIVTPLFDIHDISDDLISKEYLFIRNSENTLFPDDNIIWYHEKLPVLADVLKSNNLEIDVLQQWYNQSNEIFDIVISNIEPEK